jgi:ABC-type lipoprotein export system ATPase subunit
MIKIENVNKFYYSGSEKIHAVRNFNVTLPDQGLVFILGPSGSGKSTLLNLLGGLDSPDDGKIWIEDKDLTKLSSREKTAYLNSYLGFVFQEYNILKDLSLKENIILPLEIQGYSRKKINEKFKEIIDAVELTGLEKRKVNQLSGGQKQRIAIARALIKDPKMIIADEPTGNLDSETSRNIFNLFKRLSKQCLVIIVTHDDESALEFADMIVNISPDGDSLKEVKTNA